MAGFSVMSTPRENVTSYLVTRRAMGFKVEGLSNLLLSFAAFCEARGATRVHNDLAGEWATATIKVPVNDALFARRMDAVRIFARYQHALDPATQIPPEAICNRRYRPREPNVFSEAEVLALLAAADTLSPRFKAVTWRTLIGLLAATGMRPGEACHLIVSDIDLANGVVQVLRRSSASPGSCSSTRPLPRFWATSCRFAGTGSGPRHEPARPSSSTAGARRSTRPAWAPPSSRSSPLPAGCGSFGVSTAVVVACLLVGEASVP